MKFTFYYNGQKKKKKQIIKAETKDELMLVAKIAKCELVRNSLLKDIDFNSANLICEIKDKKYNMKQLWSLLNDKLQITENVKKNKKEKEVKKDKKKNKSKKKKNKNKKSKKDIKPIDNSSTSGLIKITRRI